MSVTLPAAPSSGPGTAGGVLLVTADPVLLDDVLRLAAAAGTTLDVAPDAGAALASWSTAAAVLVGADEVDALAARQPARRDRVLVVGHAAGDAVFRGALAVAAQAVIELPGGQEWLVETLTDLADGTVRLATTVGVVGGAGGAGATTFAVGLATTRAVDRPTLLADLDPLGPGLDHVVGLEDGEGVRWADLQTASGRLGSKALREALPRKDRLAVLTWAAGTSAPLDPIATREVLTAGQRGHDLVVLDLPRALDDAALDAVLRCDRVLVVTRTSVAAVASAGRVVAKLADLRRSIGVVTRGGGGLEPDVLADVLDVPWVAHVRDQRGLEEDLDLGLGPVRSRRGPVARAAADVLDDLGRPR